MTRETTESGLVVYDDNPNTQEAKSMCVVLWADLVCEASSSPTKVHSVTVKQGRRAGSKGSPTLLLRKVQMVPDGLYSLRC